jgi:hypothetical protein
MLIDLVKENINKMKVKRDFIWTDERTIFTMNGIEGL